MTDYKLTKTQRAIYDLTLQGMSVKEVAKELCRSPKTIETHMHSIRQIAGCRTTAKLIAAELKAARDILECFGYAFDMWRRGNVDEHARSMDDISRIDVLTTPGGGSILTMQAFEAAWRATGSPLYASGCLPPDGGATMAYKASEGVVA